MTERTINVADWNKQGLLPVTIEHRNGGDRRTRTYVFRLTEEEARKLERDLHQRNGER